jgi:D-alanyl-lipoteichoic acid acyltransferase DltB (MBOAT superfamily)
MQNFDRPYMATTIKEFWSKWHISLSGWFRDYLYIPLGGSRCSKPRHMWNLFFVFLVSGLWHGAAWTFVLWGALHGIYQIIGAITQKPRTRLKQKLGIKESSVLSRILGTVSVFSLVSFAWIFFRANTFSDLGSLLTTLFTRWEPSLEYFKLSLTSLGMTVFGAIFVLFSLIMLHILDARGISDSGSEEDCGATSHSVYRVACLFLLIVVVWLSMLESDGLSTFIYFQF